MKPPPLSELAPGRFGPRSLRIALRERAALAQGGRLRAAFSDPKAPSSHADALAKRKRRSRPPAGKPKSPGRLRPLRGPDPRRRHRPAAGFSDRRPLLAEQFTLEPKKVVVMRRPPPNWG